jgi:hypothetical protein
LCLVVVELPQVRIKFLTADLFLVIQKYLFIGQVWWEKFLTV